VNVGQTAIVCSNMLYDSLVRAANAARPVQCSHAGGIKLSLNYQYVIPTVLAPNNKMDINTGGLI